MPIATIKILEIALAALGVMPNILDAVADLLELRKRMQSGGGVTDAELDAIMDRISSRSARIQSA